jgi:hypothetical protein
MVERVSQDFRPGKIIQVPKPKHLQKAFGGGVQKRPSQIFGSTADPN